MGSGLSFLVGLRSRVENASTYYFRCDPSLTARCSDIGPRCLLGVWRLIQKLAQKLTLPVKYAISKNPANWVNLTATRYNRVCNAGRRAWLGSP